MTLPIIFISSSDDEMDTVMALNMGGDDFVSKPFSLTILDAKISAFLRRAYQFTSDNYQLEHFSLSRDGILSNGDDHITLSPTENKILAILFEHQNQVVPKEELLEKLWENESFIDQNTLSVNITRLRKKTQPLGFDRIHTVRSWLPSKMIRQFFKEYSVWYLTYILFKYIIHCYFCLISPAISLL